MFFTWLLLLLGTIGTWFLPKYNQLFFITKHTLTFVTLGLLVVFIIIMIYKKIRHSNQIVFSRKKVNILQLSTAFTIGVLLVIIAFQQNNYIDEWETPPVQMCYYYDEYGNYIHGSRMSYNCPTPNIIQDDGSILIMEFEYHFIGERDDRYSGGSSVIGGFPYTRVDDGFAMVRVELHYSENGVIEYQRYQEVINYIQLAYSRDESILKWDNQFTIENELKVTNYFEFEMVTDYLNGEIIQSKNEYILRDQIGEFSNLEDYMYYDFDESEPTYDSVLRVYYEEEDNKIIYQVYIDQPYRDLIGETVAYEGVVSKIGNEINFDFRWTDEQLNPNIEPFREISDVYLIVDDKISNRIKTRMGYYYDYSYEYIEEFGINVTLGEVITSEFVNSTSSGYHSDLIKYNNSYYFNGKYQQYVISQQEYGFLLRQYYNDGVKSDEKPYVDSGELESFAISIDYRILRSQDLFYDEQPIFSVNPIIKYFLIH